MLDDLRKQDSNSEKTQPTWSTAAKPEPDIFDKILATSDFGVKRKPVDTTSGKEKLDDQFDLLHLEPEPVEDEEAEGGEHTPEWLMAVRKQFDVPDWMKEKDADTSAPNWLDDDDLSVHIGLPEVEEDEEKFDPNQTQKVKAHKREKVTQKPPIKKNDFFKTDKYVKAIITLAVIFLYFSFTLFAGSFISFRFDEMISSLLGLYLYTIGQEHGYDLRFLLPRKK